MMLLVALLLTLVALYRQRTAPTPRRTPALAAPAKHRPRPLPLLSSRPRPVPAFGDAGFGAADLFRHETAPRRAA